MDSLGEKDLQVRADVDRVGRMLLANEVILWAGRPRAGIRLSTSDIVFIPFGFLFFGGALLWMATAIRYICPAIFGIPFVWIGYQLAIGRYVSDARLRRFTTYVLTSQRVLYVCRRPGRQEIVVGTQLEDVRRLDMRLHSDGTGSIALSTDSAISKFSNSNIRLWPSESMEGLIQFIEEPLRVFRKIREACQALTGTLLPAPDDPISYLDADEVPLWSGQPRQGLFFSREDAIVIPFSVVWFGILLTIMLKGDGKKPPPQGIFRFYEDAFFLFMMVIGGFVLIGRFFTDRFRRVHTFYAVTPRRLMIARGTRSKSVISLNRSDITSIDLAKHGDGTGTLTFNRPTKKSKQVIDVIKFERIAEADHVKKLIETTPRNP